MRMANIFKVTTFICLIASTFIYIGFRQFLGFKQDSPETDWYFKMAVCGNFGLYVLLMTWLFLRVSCLMSRKHSFEYKRTKKEMNCFMFSLWFVVLLRIGEAKISHNVYLNKLEVKCDGSVEL